MDNCQSKIMILGGNIAQVPLIEAAKEEGYYVVLVDYTTTNPGIPLADKHHQVNFMERETVLKIAQQEQVEGVISNSEAAMPVVAYVAEKANLPGNSLNSILKISSKIDFRILQKEMGIFAPAHIVTESFDEALERVNELSFPVVIKPSKSSGSRGTTKVEQRDVFSDYREDWEACSNYSMDGRVVMEEYVTSKTPDSVIEGDVFVCNGKYFWNGLFTNKRSLQAPMVPMMDVFPPVLNDKQLCEVKQTIEHLLNGAGITLGEYNIEMYYTPDDKLFCIEINARQGGNGIPDIVRKHCGVDMYKLLVTAVMGDNSYFEKILEDRLQQKYIVKQLVFSRKDGLFQKLYIDPELIPFVTDVQVLRKPGEEIKTCIAASDVVAWVDLEFESRELQLKLLDRIEHNIWPEVI